MQPIVMQQEFEVSVEALWNAITDHREMLRWYFDNIPAFEPVVGFQTQFLVTAGDRDFLHLWNVLHVVPQREITYGWRYRGYDGYATTQFVVADHHAGSQLTLTCTAREPFPQDVPQFRPASWQAGWDYFIGERLSHYLARDSAKGRPVDGS